jgi:hypothetical protein
MGHKEMKGEMREFLSSALGKRVVIITLLLLFIGAVVIIALLFRAKHAPNIESEEYDPVSGETIRVIDQEPEESSGKVALVGFIIFNKVGFTAQQQEILFNTVQDFFTEKYPEIKRLSYRQNSLRYDENDDDISYFELVSDMQDTFKVKIDTESSILKATISIFDNAGNLLN